MSVWSVAPAEADWDQLVTAIRSASDVVCLAHVSPDGDALGSALAAALAIRKLGINAFASFDEDPFRLPYSLGWMPHDAVVAPAQLPDAPDVVISFDASDAARLGSLAALGGRAGLFAAIDHHRSYTGFATLSIVDVTAPATAVLATDLIDRLGVELDKSIASCLYAGLTTDTGSFRFAGTTAQTHVLASRLHEAGIEHDQIARLVFDTASFSAVQLLGDAIARARLDHEVAGGLGLVWTYVTKEDRIARGLSLDATESIIDSVRVTAEAEIAVVIKQGDDDVWRVSTRSKGHVDLGEVCSRLGGGGHRFAAGFSSTSTPESIIESIVATVEEAQAPASAS